MTIRAVQTYAHDDGREIHELRELGRVVDGILQPTDPPRYLGLGHVVLPDGQRVQVSFPIEAATIQEAFARYREHLDRAGQEFLRRATEAARRIQVADAGALDRIPKVTP